MIQSKEQRKNLYFSLMLILFLFYYSYRYILQVNDNITSAYVYTDTPEILKWIKYILFAILLLLSFLNDRKIHLERENWIIKLPMLFLFVQCTIYGIMIRNQPILTFAIMLIPMFLYPTENQIPKQESTEKILDVFWYYTTIYEFIQIILYYTIERVPALAFPHYGSLMAIRYGGAMDDPNGYATVLIFFIFWFLMQKTSVKSMIRLVITLFMLVFTWSGTGYLALIVTAILFFLMRIKDKAVIKKYLIFAGIAVILILGCFIYDSQMIPSIFQYIIRGKGGSMEMHFKSWDVSMLDAKTWLGIHPVCLTYGEVGYIRLLEIGGIPSVIAFLIMSVGGLFRMSHRINDIDDKQKPMLYGALAYMLAFLVSMLNLPKIVNFDCMGLFTVCLILVMTGRDNKQNKEGLSTNV